MYGKNKRKYFNKKNIFHRPWGSYVNLFKKHDTDDIFVLADKLINGHNPKEVNFIQKPTENVGFFEKFFKLFN